jgi:hypothetical protein
MSSYSSYDSEFFYRFCFRIFVNRFRFRLSLNFGKTSKTNFGIRKLPFPFLSLPVTSREQLRFSVPLMKQQGGT